MGKYDPLARHLSDLPRNDWNPKFDEIEEILKAELPPSARKHRAWWGNATRGNHSQSKGWIDAGWVVKDVDLSSQRVRLERRTQPGRGGTSPELMELWQRAREISGISDPFELEKAAVETFIRRSAIKGLIALGGSMPDFEAAPRERPFT